MDLVRSLLLLFASMFLLPEHASADTPPAISWMTQIHSDARNRPADIAVDSSGNAYITGVTTGNLAGTLSGLRDAFVARFDSTGHQSWVRQFGTEVDDDGGTIGWGGDSIYVAGAWNGSDVYLQRMTVDGDLEWSQHFSGTGFFSGASELSLDSDAVYVCATRGSIAKYNTNGVLIRKTAVSPITDCDRDEAGNFYIVGPRYPGNTQYVEKRAASGNVLWAKVQFATAVATSPDALYLASVLRTNAATIMRLEPSGNLQWTQSFPDNPFAGSANAYINDVVTDQHGDVYLGGWRYDVALGYDMFIRKYAPSGDLAWEWTGDWAWNQSEIEALTIGENGRLYAVASIDDSQSLQTKSLVISFVPEPSTAGMMNICGLVMATYTFRRILGRPNR